MERILKQTATALPTTATIAAMPHLDTLEAEINDGNDILNSSLPRMKALMHESDFLNGRDGDGLEKRKMSVRSVNLGKNPSLNALDMRKVMASPQFTEKKSLNENISDKIKVDTKHSIRVKSATPDLETPKAISEVKPLVVPVSDNVSALSPYTMPQWMSEEPEEILSEDLIAEDLAVKEEKPKVSFADVAEEDKREEAEAEFEEEDNKETD